MQRREMRIEVIDDATAEMFRRMSPVERILQGWRTNEYARSIIRASVKAKHPDWTNDQVTKEVGRRFAGA